MNGYPKMDPLRTKAMHALIAVIATPASDDRLHCQSSMSNPFTFLPNSTMTPDLMAQYDRRLHRNLPDRSIHKEEHPPADS
jgi:hypothetical protein